MGKYLVGPLKDGLGVDKARVAGVPQKAFFLGHGESAGEEVGGVFDLPGVNEHCSL